jgi:signal transduction histidine kinase
MAGPNALHLRYPAGGEGLPGKVDCNVRWSIRNQILLPFAGVTLMSVLAATMAAAWLAARAQDQVQLAALQQVVGTLAQASFPINDTVLSQMRGLSGAHFVAVDSQGTPIASTLPPPAPDLERLHLPPSNDLSTLPQVPAVQVDSTRYRIARLERNPTSNAQTLYVLSPENSWNAARWQAAVYPLSVGALSVVLTAGLSFLISQRISRRLRNLESQAAAIAAGDFREISVQTRDDELRDLEISVNRMTSRLRELEETIARSERERLLAQLAGGLAHQLRNAATGAKLALQLHARRCPGAVQDQSVSVALRQLTLLETQVRGLLSLGRNEPRPRAAISVNTLLRDISELISPACEHGGVRLAVATLLHDAQLQGDPGALQAAILNLALNAIEAAGPHGAVSLSAHQTNSSLVVEVRDSGPGPAPGVMASLGQPFVTTKPEGVGLGLTLVRQVAQDHQGELSWRREGAETVFTLCFPV